MKKARIPALILAGALLTGTVQPAMALDAAIAEPSAPKTAVQPADGQTAGMSFEDIILLVRTRITVPEDADFTYNLDTDSTSAFSTIYRLRWSYEEGGVSRTLSVSVSDTGFITQYAVYGGEDEDTGFKKLPAVDRTQAHENAKKLMKTLMPEGLSAYRYRGDGSEPSLADGYSFEYVGLRGNVPVADATMTVYVDADGKVSRYSASPIRTDVSYGDTAGVIGTDGAARAYRALAQSKLIYVREASARDADGNQKSTIRPVYSLPFMYVDALTGKEFKSASSVYTANTEAALDTAAAGKALTGISLSPAEQAAVKDLSRYMNVQRAEEIARALPELGIDSRYHLRSSSLQKGWPSARYFWSLTFSRESEDNPNITERYASITLDAQSGRVQSLNVPYAHDVDKPASLPGIDKAKEAVQAVLRSLAPDVTDRLSLDSDPSAENRNVYFSYRRTENGAMFDENIISVTYDQYLGRVTGFYRLWEDDLVFPALTGVIGAARAAEVVTASNPLSLLYMPVADEQGRTVSYAPVYAFEGSFNGYVHAQSGTVVASNGAPVKDASAGYTDINGHWAAQEIRALNAVGIRFDDSRFNPDAVITEKDFLYLLSQARRSFYLPYPVDAAGLATFNESLVRTGVLKAGSTASDTPLTRLSGAVFALDYFGYGAAARLSGIYKEQDGVSADLTGYAALARHMPLLRTEDTPLTESMTRGEAAHMIFRLLKLR